MNHVNTEKEIEKVQTFKIENRNLKLNKKHATTGFYTRKKQDIKK